MCSHSDRSVLLPLTAQSCPCWPATGWTAWSIHPTFPLGFLYQDSVLLIHLLCLKTRSSWWLKWKKLSKNSGNSSRFYFLPSKITVDTDYSYEIKRRLLLGRKAMTNLDSVLLSRDITLPTKLCLVNAMVFPLVMYWCESWTIKKAEHQRTDAFELCCWRRLLRIP